MKEFESIFQAFLRGEAGFETLENSVRKTLSSDPATADAIRNTLERIYRQNRLPNQLYQLLLSAVQESETAELAAKNPPLPGDDDVDAAPEPATPDDRTRLKPTLTDDRTRLGPAHPAAASGQSYAEDETRISDRSTPEVDASVSGPNLEEPSADTPGLEVPASGVDDRAGDNGSLISTPSTSGSSSWSRFSKQSHGSSETLRIGSLLKERFELEQVLGEGGMGVVFKAKDLRKEEAQDRNPYVAIKVLNDSFKHHPEALKALQRESRKAQDLAHPNIVNVFDFDKDRDHVFMTMEYLTGAPLDQYVKEHPQGQPLKQVAPIIQGMASGLAYAHSKGIIHSDFKPSNVFVDNNRLAKIFDFGIARAAKTTGGDQGEGDKTRFDAATLGALTPAYASAEMLTGGVDPNPADDIYALACVTYELLMGHHPFIRAQHPGKKVRADDAQRENLTPERVPGLSRGQWRALEQGLAFDRGQRLRSADRFMALLLEKDRAGRKISYISGAVILLLGSVASYFPIRSYLDAKEIERLISGISSDDEGLVLQTLEEVDKATQQTRKAVYSDDGVSKRLSQFFIARSNERIDTRKSRYDYPGAEQVLQQALQLYPDSFALNEQKRIIQERKNNLINDLTTEFNRLLERGNLLPEDAEVSIPTILQRIAAAEPGHPLLSDARLAESYATGAKRALESGDLERADRLVTAALTSFPDNIVIINLRDDIDSSLQQQNRVERIALLKSQIQPRLKSAPDLPALLPIADRLIELRNLDPENALLSQADKKIHTLMLDRIESLLSKHQYTESADFLDQYAALASEGFVKDQSQTIAAAQSRFDKEIDSLFEQLSTAAQQNRLALSDEHSATSLLQKAQDLVPDDERITHALELIVNAYLNQARLARSGKAWDQARSSIDEALQLSISPDLKLLLDNELVEIDQAEREAKEVLAKAELERRESERQQKIAALHQEFDQKLLLMEPTAAKAKPLLDTLNRLAALNPADPQIRSGRDAIADRFAERSQSQVADGLYDKAMETARSGLRVIPEASQLQALLGQAESAKSTALAAQKLRDNEAIKAELEKLIADAGLDPTWEKKLQTALKKAREQLDDKAWISGQSQAISDLYLDRARNFRNQKRFSEAERLLNKATQYAVDTIGIDGERTLLAEQRQILAQEAEAQARTARIEGLKQTLLTQARANDIKNARATFESLSGSLGKEDPFMVTEAPNAIATAYQRTAERLAKRSRFTAAINLLEKGVAFAPGHSKLSEELDRYRLEKRIFVLEQSADSEAPALVAANLAQLSPELSEARAKSLKSTLEGGLAKRIKQMSAGDFSGAERLLEEARNAFPDSTVLTSIQLTKPASPLIARIEQTVAAGDLSKAEAMLAGQSEIDKESAQRLSRQINKNMQQAQAKFRQYRQLVKENKGTQAAQLLSETRTIWRDNSNFETEEKRLASLSQPSSKSSALNRSAGKPCTSRYAGYGKRSRGVCYDMLSGDQKAPLMVVVKSGSAFQQPFAISRSEISIGDWNLYCSLSGGCTRLGSDNTLPVTGIPVAQINAYSRWLSDTTGYSYRLPTEPEWEYAAQADGSVDKKGINCRITRGNQTIKGRALVDVRAGNINGWGMKHVIGNAQELVTNGGKLVARGGAYTDAHINCEISLSRPVTKGPDKTTGFRLVRLIE